MVTSPRWLELHEFLRDFSLMFWTILVDKCPMKQLFVITIFVFFSLPQIHAQDVPRPGGGGELDIGNYKGSILFPSFLKAFKHAKQECDAKSKVIMDFDHVYDYLYAKHLNAMIKGGDSLKPQPVHCHSDNGHIIDCLLNKNLKQEINHHLKDKSFYHYLSKDKKLSKKEVEARLDFLKHLVEK